MSLEVELKARVAEPEKLETALRARAELLGPYHKQDVYFRNSAGLGFRLRLENGDPIVTQKVKVIRDQMEVSQENEFTVSDAPAFRRMMENLGFSPWINKEKTGTAWQLGPVKVDFSLVTGLGHFVELEILLPLGSPPAAVAEAQARLIAGLEELGLSRDDLEPVPYTVLLGKNDLDRTH